VLGSLPQRLNKGRFSRFTHCEKSTPVFRTISRQISPFLVLFCIEIVERADHTDEASKQIYRWHQNRSAPALREEHGGNLLTFAVKGQGGPHPVWPKKPTAKNIRGERPWIHSARRPSYS
jgi:hypothetical protein